MQSVDVRTTPRELRHRSPGPWALSLREFLATYGSHTSLLVPPYDAVKPLSRLELEYQPALGAIAVGAGHDLFIVVSELSLVMQQWHWAVPCITLTPDQWQSERLLRLLPDFSTRLAIGKLQGTTDANLRTVIGAVRRRSFPTPHVLARWVCERSGVPAYYSLLLAQFEQALAGAPASRAFSVATSSRRFARLGRYTARDWRALALLSVELCAVTSTADPRVLRRHSGGHIRKYLKVPVESAATLLGWEWVLEQALRMGGYVRLTDEERVPYSVLTSSPAAKTRPGTTWRSRHS